MQRSVRKEHGSDGAQFRTDTARRKHQEKPGSCCLHIRIQGAALCRHDEHRSKHGLPSGFLFLAGIRAAAHQMQQFSRSPGRAAKGRVRSIIGACRRLRSRPEVRLVPSIMGVQIHIHLVRCSALYVLSIIGRRKNGAMIPASVAVTLSRSVPPS